MSSPAVAKLLAVAAGLLAAGVIAMPHHAPQVRIGSKKFTESVILGEMLRLAADDAKVEAVHYREFGGTRIVFDALSRGEIDVYPEYTGTIRAEIFAQQHPRDDAAAAELLASRGIGISQSLGFSNSYALAITRKRAAALGVSRISDLRRLPELRLALTHEFLERADGWPALKRSYELQQSNVSGVDHDVAYRQLLAGEIDMIDVYSTDAMIQRGDLLLLTDDQHFFPRYEAVWLFRLDLAKRHSPLLAAIRQMQGVLSESAMQAINEQVESGEKTETQAAAQFLNRLGGPRIQTPGESRTQLILRHLLEHLELVRRSLLPAIVVGTALGIFCQRFAGPGKIVLAAVGLLQTIPSLALLVMLLPVVSALGYRSIGEGSVTAVIALFGYCLLPIVRNTYVGLSGIARGTIESATVLGLSPFARLAEVELPIAVPTILAGIRTAAIQNVGFATLGAIIGAGGLGQPILRGIRVNDWSLILAGAVPAAGLALILQCVITLIERAITPRGLRSQLPSAS